MYQGLKTVTLTEKFTDVTTPRPIWQPLTMVEEERALDILFTPEEKKTKPVDTFEDCSFVGYSLAQTRAKFGGE